jgi:tetraacyldisaccharide 4'-kinase
MHSRDSVDGSHSARQMNRAAEITLAPFGALYSAAIKARSAGYQTRFLKTHRVSVPVISVGNITVGGTGKTPLVHWLAERLADQGRRVCILTRGYRRENAKKQVIVSDGKRILSDVAHSGDEAMMLAQSLIEKSAVVCNADRVSAAQWAIENLQSDVLLLDDGFQHRRLTRDLDIVTIDATNPFGNGRLLPAGILREPIKNLNRADCMVLTRTSDEGAGELIERIQQVTNAPILQSRTNVANIRRLDSADGGKEIAALNQPLAAFCGLGNPSAFFDQLRGAHLDIRNETVFRDHYKYSQADVDRLTEQAKAKGAQTLITTAKDAVKLQPLTFQLPCYVADIEVEIPDSAKLLELVENAITTGLASKISSAKRTE